MVNETKKIMHSDVAVSAMCVRVPVMRAHSESVWVETERPVAPEEARRAFGSFEGIVVMDDPARQEYPMLTFWCVADQILKGAALNAVQIAEYLAGAGRLGR